MLNLHLQHEEEEIISSAEFLNLENDYAESFDELTSIDHDLSKIVNAYENLTTLQEVVKKHGFNESIQDLVGDQLTEDQLDSSIEGIFKNMKEKVSGLFNSATVFLKISNLFFRRNIPKIKKERKNFEVLLNSKVGNLIKRKIESGDVNIMNIGLHSNESLDRDSYKPLSAKEMFKVSAISRAIHLILSGKYTPFNDKDTNASFRAQVNKFVKENSTESSAKPSAQLYSELLKDAETNLPALCRVLDEVNKQYSDIKEKDKIVQEIHKTYGSDKNDGGTLRSMKTGEVKIANIHMHRANLLAVKWLIHQAKRCVNVLTILVDKCLVASCDTRALARKIKEMLDRGEYQLINAGLHEESDRIFFTMAEKENTEVMTSKDIDRLNKKKKIVMTY